MLLWICRKVLSLCLLSRPEDIALTNCIVCHKHVSNSHLYLKYFVTFIYLDMLEYVYVFFLIRVY